MTAEIMVFHGEDVNREEAEKLLGLCLKKLQLENTACEIFDASENNKEVTGHMVVCPVGLKLSGTPAGCVTYSAKDNSADIVAINVQKHTGYISFELMSAEHMGRVFIDDSKHIEVDSVLMAAAVMYAAGVPLKNVISAINSILKN